MKRSPIRRRGRSRFPKRRNPEYCAWIRAQESILPPYDEPVDCAHVKSRGAGGYDVGGCVPLAHSKHMEQHLIGVRTFQAKYHIDLAQIAAAYGEAWAQAKGPPVAADP